MARSKQGSIVERGKGSARRIYARIRWSEWREGKKVSCEKYIRVRTRSEGREKAKQFLRELEDAGPRAFDGDSMTFAELAEEYARVKIVEAEYHGDTKIGGMRSKESAQAQLDALVRFFGPRKIREIDYESLDEFKRYRLKQPTRRGNRARKISSVHRDLERLRAVFSFAVRKRWLRESPFSFGEPLIMKSDELRRDRLPKDEEEARLLDLCTGKREHMRAILICLSDTGMRPGEAFRLTWEDVQLAAGVLYLKPKNTKTLRGRWIGMTKRLQTELVKLWERSLKDQKALVFGIKDNVKKAFASLCRDAGIEDLQLRDFRNKTSTDYQLAGVPDALAMKGTGHTQRRTYEGYVKVDQQIARMLATALEEHRAQRQAAALAESDDAGEERKRA